MSPPVPSAENSSSDRAGELRQILEALFEERAATAQIDRLDELVVGDAGYRRLYLEYIELHGNLYWDAAQADTQPLPVATPIPQRRATANRVSLATIADARESDRPLRPSRSRRTRWSWPALAAAITALLAVIVLWTVTVRRPTPDADQNPAQFVSRSDRESRPAEHAGEAPTKPAVARAVEPVVRRSQTGDPPLAPKSVQNSPPARTLPPAIAPPPVTPTVTAAIPLSPEHAEQHEPRPKDIVAFVDGRLRKAWKTAGIEPSPRASESEWLRRVYLDIVGHIPPETAVDAFLEDESRSKRADVVAELLKEPDYARNWATIWVNLLVGRQPRAPGVSRDMLEKFLRDSFSSNVPWNEVVYELVSAEGTPEQNPATNFLLAHLNNEAVPATAMTARLFLGIQVQCTQCHDHPFQSDKQSHFWELKSFFQQTEMASAAMAAPMANSDAAAPPANPPELVTRKVGGPLYYETRRGEMRVAYPIYAGHKINPAPSINRRRELARLIAKEDDRQVALAVVNRTWQHFFGYGFTRPVDDMGPHNPASNPEVLDRLAAEFIASGYDLKQLCRWICSTDAYQRASGLRAENRSDDPATGTLPLFSRFYLKPLTAEQLYDSLLVATRAKSSARTDWNDAGRRRQDWVRQFVINYGTDENDEATVPAGSVSQALLMMNDSIVRTALTVEPGTLLYDVVHAHTDDAAKIRRICRSALSRDPKPVELEAALEQLQIESDDAKSEKSRAEASARALQDLLWAFLNANEFAFVH